MTQWSNANIKVGDIFYTSWGYEQTNVEFFKVVKLVGKASVEVQELSKVYVSGDGWSGKVVPSEELQPNGEVAKMRVSAEDVPCIKFSSYRYGRLWDGKPKSMSGYH